VAGLAYTTAGYVVGKVTRQTAIPSVSTSQGGAPLSNAA